MYVCIIVCNTFTVHTITRKILELSAPILFVGTLGTLGQNEFAFGFCGRSVAAGIRAL